MRSGVQIVPLTRVRPPFDIAVKAIFLAVSIGVPGDVIATGERCCNGKSISHIIRMDKVEVCFADELRWLPPKRTRPSGIHIDKDALRIDNAEHRVRTFNDITVDRVVYFIF
ncbi:MAG: hypothetical protein AAGJ39_14920 [Pseudomonadota bacterium]